MSNSKAHPFVEAPVYIADGTWGCYYYPSVPCERELIDSENQDLGSKVQLNSDFVRNEVNIYRKIYNIPEVNLHMVIPKRVCGLYNTRMIRECTDRFSEDSISQTPTKSLPKSPFAYDKNSKWFNLIIPNIPHHTTVRNYIRSLPMNQRWIELIHLYVQITHAISIMVSSGVVHWDMHSSNILVNASTGCVHIIDFGLAIDINNPESKKIMENNFKIQPTVSRLPFEVQLLLLSNQRRRQRAKKLKDQKSNIEEDTEEDIVVSTLRFLQVNATHMQLFNKDFQNKYLEKMIEFYSNIDIDDEGNTTNDILWSGWRTWDNYSVSVLFLKIICRMFSSVFPVSNPIFSQFVRLLIQNIHYDWRKRYSAKTTLSLSRKILESSNFDYSDIIYMNQRPSYINLGMPCPESDDDTIQSTAPEYQINSK